jgi:glycosyltransferase involved in cell wall biosynthesis
MVLTEALARAVPVLVTEVGGVTEALGDGRPGMLVPPDDPDALADAVTRWLTDADLRERLRGAARGRRAELGGWAETADRVATALAGVAA